MFALKKQKGFTLIELSIVLVIIGFIMLAIIAIYANYIEQIKIERTLRAVSAAKDVAISYKTATGRYPCPAVANLPITDAAYGVSDCTITPVAGVLHGVYPIKSFDTIGGTPQFVDMIAYNESMDPIQFDFQDGEGRLLIYAVTESLSAASAPPYNPNGGVIRIETEHGDLVENAAHFVVASSGKFWSCPPSGYEFENCDGDNTFIDSIQYDAIGPTHYDDHLSFYTEKESFIWSAHLDGNTDIGDANNDNSGNVGIGTNIPTEKVEVAGNVLVTSEVKTAMVCDDATPTSPCLRPEELYTINSTSTTNPNATNCGNGKYIKSISTDPNGIVSYTCLDLIFEPLENGDCSANGYVRAISTRGRILCNIP